MSGSGRLMPRKGVSSDPKNDETLISFHGELTDTCMDLMSRVAYSNCSALPRRYYFVQHYKYIKNEEVRWINEHICALQVHQYRVFPTQWPSNDLASRDDLDYRYR